MSKAHRLTHRKSVLSQDVADVPLNFLLRASDQSLDNYELARLAAIADLRTKIQELLDKLNQEMALASLVRWFRGNDRQTLKAAIEHEETAEEWAKRMIRDRQRTEEELIPLPSLPPGSAHLAAAKRYAERNLAEAKCRVCPRPLAHNSVEYCEEHVAKSRARAQQKKALSLPGSTEYLYAGETPSTHGRQPGTLASLAKHREKKTREVLAERGLPLDSVAVGVKAAIEALLKTMPHSKADAMTQVQLFEKAGVVTGTTGRRALQQLLYTKEIRRFGKGGPLDPYRYFKSGEEPTETRKPKHLSRIKQNSALLKTMRGEEPGEEE